MKILYYPNDVLSDKDFCRPVVEFNDELKNSLDKMYELMLSEMGMGLAANQVGLPLRAFVMLHNSENKAVRLDVINPEIVPLEDEGFQQLDEGCLSFPDQFLQVSRYNKISLKFQDINGQNQEMVLSGIYAVCAQHELDHLNGVTFLEKVSRNVRRNVLKQMGLR